MALERWRSTKMDVQGFFELIDSDPEHRYVFIDGEVYMMTGGKPRHASIANTIGGIRRTAQHRCQLPSGRDLRKDAL